jgi:hypothetical protein
MYNPAATDYTSQSFAMPAARGSFNPLALRGSGLLSNIVATDGGTTAGGTTAGGATAGGTTAGGLTGNAPLYKKTWNAPVTKAPTSLLGFFLSGSKGFNSSNAFGGGDNLDSNPGWSALSDAEKAAYYAENPTMGAITQAGQKALDYTLMGQAIKAGQNYFAPGYRENQALIALGIDPMGPQYGGGVGGGYEGSINNSMSQSDMLNAQEAGMGVSNDGTYCCSRMVDLNLWSEHKQLARMHVWHHKQAKWWRAGYSVWGKVVANTLFKKKGFWTDVMDDFYNYHVKNKPRTLKSTVGDLVIYPGVAVCSLFVHDAPTTTRYVAQ